jgi:hypothetical protein
MKFLVRDYLASLRERGELDRALVDLLTAMGLRVLRSPARGQAESGLDVAAVGRLDGGEPTLYLFQVKMGNVTRSSWNTGPNAVRQSLEDLIDGLVAFRKLAKEEAAKRVVLVLAHTGVIENNVRSRYEGFVANNKRKVRIKNWDLEILAGYVVQFLLNERLFGDVPAAKLRRTLAFLEVPGYDLRHLKDLTHTLVPHPTSGEKTRQRALLQIRMVLGIVEHFALTEAGNADLATRAYELGFLEVYAWLRRDELLGKRKYLDLLLPLIDRYLACSLELLQRLDPLLDAPHGLALGGMHERVEYPLRAIRVAGLAGQWFLVLARFSEQPDVLDKLKLLARFALRLKKSVPVVAKPLFDDQMLEVGLFALTLFAIGEADIARDYVSEVVARLICGSLPEGTGNLEAVANLHFTQQKSPEYLDSSSTLLPMLAELTVLLEIPEVYRQIRERWNEKVDFQEWYPDETFPAWGLLAHSSEEDRTKTESTIVLPESMDQFRREVEERRVADAAYSACLLNDRFFDLAYHVAARLHRHRLTPGVWREFMPPVDSGSTVPTPG